MYVKFRIYILLFEIINLSFATTSKANRLLEDICETLNNNDGIQLDEDKQWEVICRELLNDKQDLQLKRDQRDVNNENNPAASPLLNKAAVRGGARAVIRTGTRGTSGGGIRTSGSGIRLPSTNRYVNTRSGVRLYRPPGSHFSPAAMIFLPLSLRHKSRLIPRSNRYTTSATNPQTYYYCTPEDENDLDEIRCNSHASGSNLCCEDEETKQVSCCTDDIPDDIKLESRATKTIERVLYTLTAITLCIHLVMRRFHR